jgi:hypothetical protein
MTSWARSGTAAGAIVGIYDKHADPDNQRLCLNSWRVAQISDMQLIDLNSAALDRRVCKPGVSGAPVFAPAEQQLIGMVVAEDSDAQMRLGFVLPAHLLCCAWPPLAQPYKGLFAFSEEDAALLRARRLRRRALRQV